MLTKFIGRQPLSHGYGNLSRGRMYTTKRMSTGLTFGTISALFGLESHIISQAHSLVTVVIIRAVVPTLVAERFFQPETVAARVDADQAEPAAAAH
jgi:hypothetical protein